MSLISNVGEKTKVIFHSLSSLNNMRLLLCANFALVFYFYFLFELLFNGLPIFIIGGKMSLKSGEVSPVLDGDLKHMVYVPKTYIHGETKNLPAILFLHGGGGVANPDNIRNQSLTKMLIEKSIPRGENFNYIVVMPIANVKGWQTDGQLAKVKSVFDKIVKETQSDQSRLYCLGQSMGGNGAYEIAAQNAGYFAAIVPVCGYLEREMSEGSVELANAAPKLAQTPIWAYHAANDAMVPVHHTDAIVDAVKKAGNENVKYTRYETAPGLPGFGAKGNGHASYELAFKEPELYDWLDSWPKSGSKLEL